MSYTSYSPDTDLSAGGTGQAGHRVAGSGRTGARGGPGGADLAVDGGAALGQVAAGLQGGADARAFQAGIDTGQRVMGNRAFLRWVGELQTLGRDAVEQAMTAPLQLMGKKKKKQESAEVKAGSGAEGVAQGEEEKPEAAGTSAQPTAQAATGPGEKKKKKSRVQVALNELRGKGVAAFGDYIEAEIGEAALLRTLVERITRAEDLKSIRAGALALVQARLRLLDPRFSRGAGAEESAGAPEGAAPALGKEPERAVSAPVKPELSRREQDLFDACVAGNAGRFRHLLRHGNIDINVANGNGTLLCHAAFVGHANIVRELLSAPGIDVNLAQQNGATALFIAAQENRVKVVELLLDKRGIDVNLAMSRGATPLYIAAERGHTEVLERLLAAPGIDINAHTRTGTTPLYIAAEKGHAEVVKRLLAAPGIDIDKQRQDGSSALFIAIQQNFAGIVEQLVRWGADADQALLNGASPLYKAAHSGYLEVVRVLLQAPGVRVNRVVGGRFIPLLAAVQRGHKDIVRLLLRNGADPNMKSDAGLVPLHAACFRGDTAIVEMLLHFGADTETGVTDLAGERQTPDSLAELSGHREVLSLLAAHRRRRETAPPLFSLDEKTRLDADAVEGEIKRYLGQAYHRFVGQAVNDMESGRGKPTPGYPGLRHATAGVAGMGSCAVFYYLDAERNRIRVAGIGHHLYAETYRLDYATAELGGVGQTLRVA